MDVLTIIAGIAVVALAVWLLFAAAYLFWLLMPIAVCLVCAVAALRFGHDNLAALLVLGGIVLQFFWGRSGGWWSKIADNFNFNK